MLALLYIATGKRGASSFRPSCPVASFLTFDKGKICKRITERKIEKSAGNNTACRVFLMQRHGFLLKRPAFVHRSCPVASVFSLFPHAISQISSAVLLPCATVLLPCIAALLLLLLSFFTPFLFISSSFFPPFLPLLALPFAPCKKTKSPLYPASLCRFIETSHLRNITSQKNNYLCGLIITLWQT